MNRTDMPLSNGQTLSVERCHGLLTFAYGSAEGVVLSVDGGRTHAVIPDDAVAEVVARIIEATRPPGDEDQIGAWHSVAAAWLQSERSMRVLQAFCDVTQNVDRGR
jgi:hypothetical protein